MKLGRRLPRLVGVAGLTVGALSAAGITATSLLVTAPPAGAAGCSPAGATGLTASMVATPGQTIDASSIGSSTLDATGCDIGIYVPPSADGVTIGSTTTAGDGITISGANDTGIFAEQNSRAHRAERHGPGQRRPARPRDRVLRRHRARRGGQAECDRQHGDEQRRRRDLRQRQRSGRPRHARHNRNAAGCHRTTP